MARTVEPRLTTWLRLGSSVCLLPLLIACSQAPDYVKPVQDVGVTFRNQAAADPVIELPRPTTQWWKDFGSPELTALVDEALRNNYDLKAATQRIARATAQFGASEATLFPTIEGTASDTLDSPRNGKGSRTGHDQGKSERLYEYGLSASYEVDLWGKNRAGVDSALATAQASYFDRETVAITLVSDVVNTYVEYLRAKDREAVANNSLRAMTEALAAVSERARIGESNRLEVVQQRSVLARTQAKVHQIAIDRERAVAKLAVLLGRPPATLELKGSGMKSLTIPAVSAGIPSDLLLRRPDIKKAEADLRAANADIGVARANLLPSFKLTGERGFASQNMGTILAPMSIFYTIAQTVTATIFDYGAGKAAVEEKRALYEELVAKYHKQVLTALGDVEDALAQVRYNAEYDTAHNEALGYSREAFSLSEEQFALGMIDYPTLLETERTLYETEDVSVQAHAARLTAAVALYKALGGDMLTGVEDKPPTTITISGLNGQQEGR